MSDPWEAILSSLEPDYKILKDIMESGPKFFPDLSQRGRKWIIILQEEFNLINDHNYLVEDHLGEVVNWSTNQLVNWKNVRRIAYDQWEFKTKKDAEKFQVMFNLKWAR